MYGGSPSGPPPRVPDGAGAAGPPDPGPSGRSPLRLVVPLGIAAIALAIVLLAHGSSGGPNPMVEAAKETAKVSGAKYAAELSESVEGGTGSINGTGFGAYDAHSHRAEVTLDMTIPGHGEVSLESIGNSRVVYTRSSVLAEKLPPGTEWLGMEPTLGHSLENAFGGGASPESSMQMMESVGNVEELGRQTVRGHLTTRYRGTVEMAKLAQVLSEKGEAALAKLYEQVVEKGLKEVEIETWIDSRGLARQIRLVEQVPLTEGHSLTVDMRMQFYDFGAKPKIKFPAQHLVLDYTPVIRAELGMLDGTSLGPLKAPAGAKSLTAHVFSHRATAICHRLDHEIVVLERGRAGVLGALRNVGPGSVASGQARSAFDAYARQLAEPTYEIGRRGIESLARLRPPAGDAGAYRRYLQMGAKGVEWMLAEARALQMGAYKVPGLEEAKAEVKAEEGASKRLAEKLGLGSCEVGGGEGASSGPTV